MYNGYVTFWLPLVEKQKGFHLHKGWGANFSWCQHFSCPLATLQAHWKAAFEGDGPSGAVGDVLSELLPKGGNPWNEPPHSPHPHRTCGKEVNMLSIIVWDARSSMCETLRAKHGFHYLQPSQNASEGWGPFRTIRVVTREAATRGKVKKTIYLGLVGCLSNLYPAFPMDFYGLKAADMNKKLQNS